MFEIWRSRKGPLLSDSNVVTTRFNRMNVFHYTESEIWRMVDVLVTGQFLHLVHIFCVGGSCLPVTIDDFTYSDDARRRQPDAVRLSFSVVQLNFLVTFGISKI